MLDTKAIYKNYCYAIQQSTGYQGAELSDAIRNANRMCYRILFKNSDIRQRDMDEQQLQALAQHRLMMTQVMLAKATQQQ